MAVAPSTTSDCWCFDLCDDAPATEFVARTRDVHLDPARVGTGAWLQYVAAVYAGRGPHLHDLSAMHFFYLNSPSWRAQYPDAPNPFRDCQEPNQAHCGAARCEKTWHAPLQQHPRVLKYNMTSLQERVRSRFVALHGFPEGLPGVLLFSDGVDGFGHTSRSVDGFVEVMRHDNLRWNWPGTEEGTRDALHREPPANKPARIRGAHGWSAQERIHTNLTARITGWASNHPTCRAQQSPNPTRA
jgi:hypothetical protein